MPDRLTYPLSTRNYFHVALWLTQSSGSFAAENLAVDMEYGDRLGGDTRVELVRKGIAQASTLGVEHILADREAGGDNLVAIAGAINGLPFSLIAQPSIKKIGDLRAKVIGVSSLDYGSSGILIKHLEANGLQPGDYKLLAVGAIEKRWEMLRSGEIDAGLQGVPLNFVATDAGLTDLGTPASTFPNFQFLCVVANARWARENRGIAVRFLRALLRGIKLFHSDRLKSGEIAMHKTGLAKSYVDRAWEAYVNQRIYPLNGEVDLAGVQTVIDMRAAVHGVTEKVVAQDLVDHSYLVEARGTL